jgi:hypothetical protein
MITLDSGVSASIIPMHISLTVSPALREDPDK